MIASHRSQQQPRRRRRMLFVPSSSPGSFFYYYFAVLVAAVVAAGSACAEGFTPFLQPQRILTNNHRHNNNNNNNRNLPFKENPFDTIVPPSSQRHHQHGTTSCGSSSSASSSQQQDQESDGNSENVDHHQQQQEPPKEEEPIAIRLDRVALRLDGMEVYAVVSALTLATSIQFFEFLSQHWDWGVLTSGGGMISLSTMTSGTIFLLLSDIICLITSAVSMITGLHATLVFSLITMYGRTAAGRGLDTAFLNFFRRTSAIRTKGFRSFRISMYAFGIQMLFVVISKLPTQLKWIRRLSRLILVYSIWKIYRDTQFIIQQAGNTLFSTAPPTTDNNKNN